MWDVQIKFQALGFDLAQTSYYEHLEELIRDSKTSFCLSFVCVCLCVCAHVHVCISATACLSMLDKENLPQVAKNIIWIKIC